MAMALRTFATAGPRVGAVGFGAMSFAGFYAPATEEESQRALAAALETGTTHWDTSDVYGNGLSEEIIGRFLKAHPGARAKIHLATKGGIKRKTGSTERVFDNSPEHFRAALEGSLKRLGVDHVDLYYVHRREQARPVEEVADTMARFVKEGKIKGYGLSEVAPATIRRAHAVHPITAVQSEYSLWSRLPELGVLQACREAGAAFVAFSPLARAFLCGTVTSTEGFGPLDFRKPNPRFVEPNFAANLKAIAPFLAMAKRRGCTPGQLALAWVLAQGDHIIPIPGTRYARHVEDNAGAAAITLSADDRREIERILPAGFRAWRALLRCAAGRRGTLWLIRSCGLDVGRGSRRIGWSQRLIWRTRARSTSSCSSASASGRWRSGIAIERPMRRRGIIRSWRRGCGACSGTAGAMERASSPTWASRMCRRRLTW